MRRDPESLVAEFASAFLLEIGEWDMALRGICIEEGVTELSEFGAELAGGGIDTLFVWCGASDPDLGFFVVVVLDVVEGDG